MPNRYAKPTNTKTGRGEGNMYGKRYRAFNPMLSPWDVQKIFGDEAEDRYSPEYRGEEPGGIWEGNAVPRKKTSYNGGRR